MAKDPVAPTPAERAQWLNAVDQQVRLGALTPADFRLAWRIANAHVNSKTGNAWPSQETLATDMGVSVRSVRDSIGRLRKAQLLTIARASRNDSNVMRLNLSQALAQPQRTLSDRQDSASRDDPSTGKILPVGQSVPGAYDSYLAFLTGRILPVREAKSRNSDRQDSASESTE